tara:strand:- start:77 stop:190 length:114 start_codon:yes stop_codon:yes gene_type:complete
MRAILAPATIIAIIPNELKKLGTLPQISHPKNPTDSK